MAFDSAKMALVAAKGKIKQPIMVRKFVMTHRKRVIITASVILLDIAFGFDAKFTIINFIWLIF
jgi:hypothetical protein